MENILNPQEKNYMFPIITNADYEHLKSIGVSNALLKNTFKDPQETYNKYAFRVSQGKSLCEVPPEFQQEVLAFIKQQLVS